MSAAAITSCVPYARLVHHFSIDVVFLDPGTDGEVVDPGFLAHYSLKESQPG